jgi:hypothetical protein
VYPGYLVHLLKSCSAQSSHFIVKTQKSLGANVKCFENVVARMRLHEDWLRGCGDETRYEYRIVVVNRSIDELFASGVFPRTVNHFARLVGRNLHVRNVSIDDYLAQVTLFSDLINHFRVGEGRAGTPPSMVGMARLLEAWNAIGWTVKDFKGINFLRKVNIWTDAIGQTWEIMKGAPLRNAPPSPPPVAPPVAAAVAAPQPRAPESPMAPSPQARSPVARAVPPQGRDEDDNDDGGFGDGGFGGAGDFGDRIAEAVDAVGPALQLVLPVPAPAAQLVVAAPAPAPAAQLVVAAPAPAPAAQLVEAAPAPPPAEQLVAVAPVQEALMAANGDDNDMEDVGEADESEADDDELAAMAEGIRLYQHFHRLHCARRRRTFVFYSENKKDVLRKIYREFGAGWRNQGFHRPEE